MYDHILLATDGTEEAQRAVDHALELAARLDAQLTVLSVYPEAPTGTHQRDAMRSDPEEEAAQAVEEVARAGSRVGVETETLVRKGVPQEAIVEIADNSAADMVVLGTHGRTGLDHLLTGSVAETVVRNATIPVLTVRALE